MTSPVMPRRPGAENVARASPPSRSRSADTVVPVSSIGRRRPHAEQVEGHGAIGLGVDPDRSARSAVVVTAAARISRGSVSSGAAGAVWHAPAARAVARMTRRRRSGAAARRGTCGYLGDRAVVRGDRTSRQAPRAAAMCQTVGWTAQASVGRRRRRRRRRGGGGVVGGRAPHVGTRRRRGHGLDLDLDPADPARREVVDGCGDAP